MNMTNLKLQAEYRPRDSKHYFRLAGDFLNEMDDTVSNDLSKFAQGEQSKALYAANAANNRRNSAYDRWNNFLISDAEAMVLTFEYRYQLAENTRIRVVTNFDLRGDFGAVQRFCWSRQLLPMMTTTCSGLKFSASSSVATDADPRIS